MRPSIILVLGACTSSTIEPTESPRDVIRVTIENTTPFVASQSGGLVTPAGPGDHWEISFDAGRSERLSFATELAESTDWFVAPSDRGLALYDANGPVSGDVTDQLHLYSLGTKFPEELGIGADTKNNQTSAQQGDQSSSTISITQITDGAPYCPVTCEMQFDVPKLSDMLRATLTPTGPGTFTLHIENVSTETTLVTRLGTQAVHFSPPVWAVHPVQLGSPIFRVHGTTDRSMIALAEDGDNSPIVAHLETITGEGTPLGNAVWAVHRDGHPLYLAGEPDRGLGMEQLAEDGDATTIAASMAADPTISTSGALGAPFGVGERSPLYPGEAFVLFLAPQPGDRLSLATMFGTSNDWFFATASDGVPFYNDDGTLVIGEIPMELLDLGTEIDQPLRYGADTAPMQALPGQGAHDPDPLVRGVTGAHAHGYDAALSVRFDHSEIDPDR